jgi:hypothetical protein
MRSNVTIGQWITVFAVASLEYDGDCNRELRRRPCAPFSAIITGQAIRQIGRYRSSSGGGYSGMDYDPASLKVTGTVTLWTFRAGLANRELMVHDFDFEPAAPGNLPYRAPRPDLIREDVQV